MQALFQTLKHHPVVQDLHLGCMSLLHSHPTHATPVMFPDLHPSESTGRFMGNYGLFWVTCSPSEETRDGVVVQFLLGVICALSVISQRLIPLLNFDPHPMLRLDFLFHYLSSSRFTHTLSLSPLSISLPLWLSIVMLIFVLLSSLRVVKTYFMRFTDTFWKPSAPASFCTGPQAATSVPPRPRPSRTVSPSTRPSTPSILWVCLSLILIRTAWRWKILIFMPFAPSSALPETPYSGFTACRISSNIQASCVCAGNHIGATGAKFIADSLRINSTLRSICIMRMFPN